MLKRIRKFLLKNPEYIIFILLLISPIFAIPKFSNWLFNINEVKEK